MKVEAEKDGSFLVTLAIDEDWLNDEARVYPVVLDPTLYVQPDTADGALWNDVRTPLSGGCSPI